MKITIHESDGVFTIKPEGRLVGPWVDELKRAAESLQPGDSRIEIDLCGVTFADLAGRDLLAAIYRQRAARFITNSPLTEHLAQEAMHHNQTENGKGLSS